MDPQQRLLLEVAWEALEDAGLPADRLRRQRDRRLRRHAQPQRRLHLAAARATPEDIDAYTSTGTAHSIVANRLSYLLDLRGPSVAVDTACSSSLVAVHLAVPEPARRRVRPGAGRRRQPDADARGHRSPLSRLRMLRPTAAARPSTPRADGFVRGEGCGVVVLKRLSDAQAAGDPILAVIRGSAVNQDGRTNGLTAPNGLAQRERRAPARWPTAGSMPPAGRLRRGARHRHAARRPDRGRGAGRGARRRRPTRALPARLGQDQHRPPRGRRRHRRADQGRAGAAARRRSRRTCTSSSSTRTSTSRGTRFAHPDCADRWPSARAERVAGVSSFGFGGTNAHVVLKQAPRRRCRRRHRRRPATAAAVSAHSSAALRALAAAYAGHARPTPPPLDDIVPHRKHAGAATTSTASPWSARRPPSCGTRSPPSSPASERPEVAPGRADPETRRRLVFVFSGQGAQWPGMGRELIATRARVPRGARGVRPLLAPARRLVAARRARCAGRAQPPGAHRGRAAGAVRAAGGAGRALALLGHRARRRGRPQRRRGRRRACRRRARPRGRGPRHPPPQPDDAGDHPPGAHGRGGPLARRRRGFPRGLPGRHRARRGERPALLRARGRRSDRRGRRAAARRARHLRAPDADALRVPLAAHGPRARGTGARARGPAPRPDHHPDALDRDRPARRRSRRPLLGPQRARPGAVRRCGRGYRRLRRLSRDRAAPAAAHGARAMRRRTRRLDPGLAATRNRRPHRPAALARHPPHPRLSRDVVRPLPGRRRRAPARLSLAAKPLLARAAPQAAPATRRYLRAPRPPADLAGPPRHRVRASPGRRGDRLPRPAPDRRRARRAGRLDRRDGRQRRTGSAETRGGGPQPRPPAPADPVRRLGAHRALDPAPACRRPLVLGAAQPRRRRRPLDPARNRRDPRPGRAGGRPRRGRRRAARRLARRLLPPGARRSA